MGVMIRYDVLLKIMKDDFYKQNDFIEFEFEDVLSERQRARVLDIKNTLIQCGALGANMSGTGPTAFGLFRDETAAKMAYEQLKEQYQETYLAQTV